MTSDVKRDEPRGISVLVCGAGIGGIYAALELWRRGCDVRICERSSSSNTLGDSFTIGPTAIRSFRNWPMMAKRNKEISFHPLFATHNQKGERQTEPVDFSTMLSKDDKGETTTVYRHARPKFHKMLLDQLTDVGLHVEYNKEVREYCEDASTGRAGATFSDGTRYDADLVVAADGIRGKSWPLVAGHEIPARPSGQAIFRVAYPVELILDDPTLTDRFKLTDDGRSVIEMWRGADMYAIFWRNEETMSWAINHNDEGTAEESWGHRAPPDEALKLTAKIPGWPEYADRVIKKTPPNMLTDWKLMWREPNEKWTSPAGHLIQLGDAAHTFLPSSGNGGTQALEDAVSLAACIAKAGKANIPNATRVHNLLRFQRTSCLQAMGIANREARAKHSQTQTKAAHGNGKGSRDMFMGRWLIEHDPEEYAFANYDKALAHLEQGAPFESTNIPVGIDYKPWTIDSLLKAMEKGEKTILDGDWS